jgi:alpha-tubulin suppressor-like RCC1 family protein
VYATGGNNYGEYGSEDNVYSSTFRLVPFYSNEPITHLECGGFHTMIVTGTGTLYSTGRNHRGQLGLRDLESRNKYHLVPFSNRTISHISCGENFSVLCVDAENTTGFQIWSTGDNTKGQLGLGNYVDRTVFNLVATFNQKLLSLSCGSGHVMLVTDTNEIWVAGSNTVGQLGSLRTTSRSIFKFKKLTYMNNIRKVVCGSVHSLVIDCK